MYKDEELYKDNIDINTTPRVKKYTQKGRLTNSPYAKTNRTSKSKRTPFENVKCKKGKKIRMNKHNKLKQKTLKKHNKIKQQYRRLETFTFDLNATLKQIQNAAKKKTYKCPFFHSCQFENYSKWSVCEHVRGHHASRPYKCDVCGKTYKRLRIYNTHLKIHNL